jgi:hypothetical protein
MVVENKIRVVPISSTRFIGGCLLAAVVIFFIGAFHAFSAWVIALEVFLTIVSLFFFGSIKYRIDKNALTCGAGMVIMSTFWWNGGPGLRCEPHCSQGSTVLSGILSITIF